ncbi:MAG TPA: N-acetylmuramoyl-L-alanine amidase [bacterium]|nr:N-acetylmuramoyl-L-alanine amidase [bacterium]
MSCPSVKKFLLGLATAAVLGPVSARATDLLAVRHWSAPDHTRIVIDLSEAAAYLHWTLEDPPRIAVDVADGAFRFPTAEVPIEDGIVKRLRFNVLSGGKAQVVLDLERETRYDVFALEKIENKPDRIVVDVKKPVSSVVPTIPRREPRPEQIIGPETFGDFVIMIDPGHGGEDTGRRNPDGVKEKHLALEFSEALVAEINSRRGYRAELTRKGDYFVSLARRREIAEERGAHLFISIHFNAAPATSARGTEVFFVSLTGADSRATRELEEAENSADLVGGVPPIDRETETNLARMLVNLRQNDSVERSQRLATIVTDHVDRVRGIETRRVKQAGFAVLKSLFIPAILVEVGFLTNRDDVRFVRSDANRTRYVAALADGVVQYVEDVEVPRLGWKIHTVNRGETLSQIAVAYSMDVQALRGANGLPGDRIYPGQKLRVRPR